MAFARRSGGARLNRIWGSEAQNSPFLQFGPDDSCTLTSYGQTLSLQARIFGRGWYTKNVESAALPDIRNQNNLVCCLYEIEDTRAITKYMCVLAWNYVVFNDIHSSLNSLEEYNRNYENMFKKLYQFLHSLKKGYSALQKPLALQSVNAPPHLSDSIPNLRKLMLCDPLSSSYFRQVGQLMLTLGELLFSSMMQVNNIPNPAVAYGHRETICSYLLNLGTLFNTMSSESIVRELDTLDTALDETMQKISSSTPNMQLTDENAFENNCARVTQGPMNYSPFLDVGPMTELPTALNYMKLFHSYLHSTLSFISSTTLDAISKGLVIAANANMLSNMHIIDSLIGRRFCQEFAARKQMKEIKNLLFTELVPTVFKMGNEMRYNRHRWFQTTEDLRMESLQKARVVCTCIERSSGEIWPSMDLVVPLQYRFRTIGFLSRLMRIVIEVLENPCKFESSQPFKEIIYEQERYIDVIAKTRLNILDFPPPELPPITTHIRTSLGLLSTGYPDIDKFLQLKETRDEPIFYSFA